MGDKWTKEGISYEHPVIVNGVNVELVAAKWEGEAGKIKDGYYHPDQLKKRIQKWMPQIQESIEFLQSGDAEAYLMCQPSNEIQNCSKRLTRCGVLLEGALKVMSNAARSGGPTNKTADATFSDNFRSLRTGAGSVRLKAGRFVKLLSLLYDARKRKTDEGWCKWKDVMKKAGFSDTRRHIILRGRDCAVLSLIECDPPKHPERIRFYPHKTIVVKK